MQLRATDSDGISTTTRIRVGPDKEGDGCMDFYTFEGVQTSPFSGMSSEDEMLVGSANHFFQHWAAPGGQVGGYSVAHATTGGFAAGSTHSQLEGSFTATEPARFLLTFDANLEGLLEVTPAPIDARSQIYTYAAVVDAGDAVQDVLPLLGSELVLAERGVKQTRNANLDDRFPMPVGTLPAGDYRWQLHAVTHSTAIAGPDETIVSVGVWWNQLRSVTVCRQRLPDDVLP